MLHPAQKIASFFVAKKLIPAQDYEWAVYGLQRRLLAAVFYPILFLIGLQVTDPDVTNQQSSSSYSSGKYYINSSVVYSTCDYFAA